MATPIREQLLILMKSTIEAMRVTNGYFYDVATGAVSLDPSANLLTTGLPASKPIFTLQPEVGADARFFPASQLFEEFQVSVTARYDVDDIDPMSKMRAWERLGADMEKAFAEQADGSFWCGALAVDSRIGPINPFIGVGSPIVLIVRTLSTRLYRKYGQPSS